MALRYLRDWCSLYLSELPLWLDHELYHCQHLRDQREHLQHCPGLRLLSLRLHPGERLDDQHPKRDLQQLQLEQQLPALPAVQHCHLHFLQRRMVPQLPEPVRELRQQRQWVRPLHQSQPLLRLPDRLRRQAGGQVDHCHRHC